MEETRENRFDPQELIRPHVRRLRPYAPGEQPTEPGVIKLNTNENPYPPSPLVLEATRRAVDGRLRLYPSPGADRLRRLLADLYGCSPENLIVGNGSDELLGLACRAFVAPRAAGDGRRRSEATVQFFTPSYSLYPVLADIHNAWQNPVPLELDFSLPPVEKLERERKWDFAAALTYITTPNAPSGRGYSVEELEELCRRQRGVVILDEAYAEFAEQNALSLALRHPHVIVSRTFSKAYCLCFQRVGYFIGSPELIGALHKIRDSYNVNGLGQAAAEATLADLAYYRENFRRIQRTREETARALRAEGFQAFPSQTNFLFARPPGAPANVWQEALRSRRILVRWFDQPRVRDFLRITVGSEEEMARFVEAVVALRRELA
ncbi:MAG: histidinol-phosphate transaminase [Verrucomicrobia bacterium]|nr:histidinol-phosphate transaminase [Verrucomicrobiota bacterium]